MLVLTRKKNDTIIIDGRITVQVLQVKGGGIRLGITAPEDVSILRGELKPFGVEGDEADGSAGQITLPLDAAAPTTDSAPNTLPSNQSPLADRAAKHPAQRSTNRPTNRLTQARWRWA